MVSARSSKTSRFSRLTPEAHGADGLLSFCTILRFQMMIDASILFFRSKILCSDDMSMLFRNWSGSKNSTVIFLYI